MTGILFILLFTSTTYFQVVAQDRLNAHGQNDRTLYNEYGRHRGPIVVDGHAIASSQASGDTYGYLRSYDPGGMYAPVTGYYSVVFGFTGIERSLNDTLSGDADRCSTTASPRPLGQQGQGASVELTLDSAAQEAAWEALDGRRGSVVALDPETGAVLAMVSTPSFDPNSWPRTTPARSPRLDRAQRRPGPAPDQPSHRRGPLSAGLGVQARGGRRRPRVRGVHLGDGDPRPGDLRSAELLGGDEQPRQRRQEPCGPDGVSTLADALRQSCNTSFALLGTDRQDRCEDLEEFGFGQGSRSRCRDPLPLGEDLDARSWRPPRSGSTRPG